MLAVRFKTHTHRRARACTQAVRVAGMPEEAVPAALETINASGFHGCIRKLYINHELQDFTRSHLRAGVVPGCQACRKLYCAHGACQPDAPQVS